MKKLTITELRNIINEVIIEERTKLDPATYSNNFGWGVKDYYHPDPEDNEWHTPREKHVFYKFMEEMFGIKKDDKKHNI